MKGRWAAVVLAMLVLIPPVAAVRVPVATLSAEEGSLVAHIDRHFDKQIAFLERVVNINSETMNHVGVRRVSQVFDGLLQELGFSTRWIDLQKSLSRAGHLVAERTVARMREIVAAGALEANDPRDRGAGDIPLARLMSTRLSTALLATAAALIRRRRMSRKHASGHAARGYFDLPANCEEVLRFTNADE